MFFEVNAYSERILRLRTGATTMQIKVYQKMISESNYILFNILNIAFTTMNNKFRPRCQISHVSAPSGPSDFLY